MTHTYTSYFHRGGLEPLLGATIPEHFAGVVERFSDREAVVSIQQRRRLSHAELALATDILARGLVGVGFNKGDRIAIWSTSYEEFPMTVTGKIQKFRIREITMEKLNARPTQ